VNRSARLARPRSRRRGTEARRGGGWARDAPPNLRYLIVTEDAKGYFGCVHLSTDGTFDPKKLVLRHVDLEEWGTGGNLLMGIEYDGTAYAIDGGESSTRGTDSATAFVVQYGKHSIKSIDEITGKEITDEDDD